MAFERVRVGHEVGQKRSFSWAVDWPGWCRAGRDIDAADAALIAAASRYAPVAAGRHSFPGDPGSPRQLELEVVETVAGSGATEFGVPYAITDHDRQPVSRADAERLASLVAAAWTVFDRTASAAPAELRKGPRGGGRDRDGVVAHVVAAEHAYARELGLRIAEPAPTDPAAVAVARDAVLAAIRLPSDGSPIAGRKWTTRYAARRIAWHALDHAWEIEDRSRPL